jgi:hypothetical protein
MRTIGLKPRAIAVATFAAALLLPVLSSPLRADDTDKAVTKRVILTPKVVSDDFGKRIAQTHLAVQVTVANTSKDKDLIIEAASLDLTKALTPARMAAFQQRVADVNKKLNLTGSDAYQASLTGTASSVDLELLQGVIQKGQNYDPRNQAYRAIVAIGTIGAGLVGVAGLGPVLPRAVAAWSGPGLTAFSTLFPDLTVDEVIRLSNQAYTANIVVPKQKSKVFVVFIPLDLIMDTREKGQYWHHPSDFMSLANGPAAAAGAAARPDLSQVEVEVQYDFIVPVNDVPPNVTDVVFDAKELDNFAALKPVHGSVVGRFLDGATVSLPDADALGLSIAPDTAPKSDDNRLYFIITPKKVPPAGSRLTFQLTKGKQVSSFSKLLAHHLPAPTLTSISPASGSAKSDVPVTLAGSGFFEGDVSILFDGSSDASVSGIKINNLKVKEASIEVTFSIDEKAKAGDRQVQVLTSGGLTGMQKFTVAPAAAPK